MAGQMDLDKYVIKWDGFPGAPGYTVLYGPTLSAHEADIKNLFASIKNQFPQNVFWTFPNSGFMVDSSTGIASGTWSTAAVTTNQGSDVGKYAAPVGGCVIWRTAGINARGHRVKGRTFFVPMAGSAFDVDGTFTGAVVTSWNAAFTAFLGAVTSHLVVWTRPRSGTPGAVNPVTGYSLSDKAAVLRSRRP